MQISESKTLALTMLELARLAGKSIPRVKHVNIKNSLLEIGRKTIFMSGYLVNDHYFECICDVRRIHKVWLAERVNLCVSINKGSLSTARVTYHSINAGFRQDGEELILTYGENQNVASIASIE